MKITLTISKLLKKYFSEETLELEVDTYRDIISACLNMFFSFKNQVYVDNKYELFSLVNGDRVITQDQLDFKVSSEQVYLVPTIQGYSSIFYSQNNLDIFYGGSVGPSNEEIESSTLTRRIQDSALFGKNKTMFDITLRDAQNDAGLLEKVPDTTTSFGPLKLNSSSGQTVPISFGHVRISGTVINSYIKRISRVGTDTISVQKYVN